MLSGGMHALGNYSRPLPGTARLAAGEQQPAHEAHPPRAATVSRPPASGGGGGGGGGQPAKRGRFQPKGEALDPMDPVRSCLRSCLPA